MNEEIDREGFPEPADPVTRVSAKLIDVLIAAVLAKLAAPVGMLAGLGYLLLADGMLSGQSFGKRLLGLRVIQPPTGLPASYGQSALRNSVFALLYVLVFLPPLGYVLALVLGVFIMGVEFYAIFRDPHGLRMGDLFAKTEVVGELQVPLGQELEPDSTSP